MKQIPLTKGRFATVDDDKYDELAKYKWRVDGAGYASRVATKQERKAGSTREISMARYLLGVSSVELCDHINRDKLDNRLENLRKATSTQNIINAAIRSDNTSGYRGVSKDMCSCKTPCKWIAKIGAWGKVQHIGIYNTKEEAAIAYNRRAVELFGEYASLNMIKGEDTQAGAIRQSMEEGK